jgi:TonB family protein
MANPPVSASGVHAERKSGEMAGTADAALNLLFPWPEEERWSRWHRSFVASFAIHIALFFATIQLKSIIPTTPEETVVRRVTPLYLPPDLLTQRAPNKGELSKSFDLARLMTSQQAERRISAPVSGSVRKLQIPKQKVQTAPKPVLGPEISAQPPKEIAANEPPPAGLVDSAIAAAPAAPAPSALPTPAPGSPESRKEGAYRITVPKNSIHDVLQQMARGNSDSSNVVVSDDGANTVAPAAPGQQSLQGHMNSEVELKTDPQGADFKPYLRQILAIVRRNWFSVLPDSARIGVLRGSTTIQFIVNRDGSIPKLVIADSSGAQALDRAAVAGLSMSNPLPPLPADFKGGLIRLQFSFNYNMPRQ